ncbi:MAG: chorismate mutase [Acidimicrobiales bacterium]
MCDSPRSSVRAIRGATTLSSNTEQQVKERVAVLVGEMLDSNGLVPEQVISVLLTATDDVTAMFPATAARDAGLGEVPLLGARELAVEGSLRLCVRVLMHITTERSPGELRHVYLEGARTLRPDLAT